MAATQPVLLGEITEPNQRLHTLPAYYATTDTHQGCLATTVAGELQITESLDTMKFEEGFHSGKHVLKILFHNTSLTGLDGRDLFPILVALPPLVPY